MRRCCPWRGMYGSMGAELLSGLEKKTRVEVAELLEKVRTK